MKFKSFPILSLLSLPASGVVIYQTSDIRVGNILADPPYVRSFLMDVNNDGTTDWQIGTGSTSSFSSVGLNAPSSTLFIYRPNSVDPSLGTELTPLLIDDPITSILGDPNLQFLTVLDGLGAVLAISGGDGEPGDPSGPFNGKTAYLGFRFEAATGSHYGYALLQDVTSSSAIITAYAWESEPNTAILAGAIPEPSAPLLLSLASLLMIGRRARS
ncbi:hypothetical protein V2O64_02645 [Verrucomicrobiaceae bacterium 227]